MQNYQRNRVVYCLANGAVEMAHEEEGKAVQQHLFDGPGSLHCMQVFGDQMLAGGELGNVSLWNVETCQLYRTIEASCRDRVRAVCGGYCPPDQRPTEAGVSPVIYAGMQDGTIEAWDLRVKPDKPLRVFLGHTAAVTCVVATGEEGLASGSLDGTVQRWDLRISAAHGGPMWPLATATYTMHEDGITDLLVSQGWLYSVNFEF